MISPICANHIFLSLSSLSCLLPYKSIIKDNLGQNWEKLENYIIFKNKLKVKSDLRNVGWEKLHLIKILLNKLWLIIREIEDKSSD